MPGNTIAWDTRDICERHTCREVDPVSYRCAVKHDVKCRCVGGVPLEVCVLYTEPVSLLCDRQKAWVTVKYLVGF